VRGAVHASRAPPRRVVWRAAALAEVHALRGYDAVHLASALDVGEAAYFVTSDRQLANAARAEGFPVYVPA
jgi:predicted nucleic acid-binding protein